MQYCGKYATFHFTVSRQPMHKFVFTSIIFISLTMCTPKNGKLVSTDQLPAEYLECGKGGGFSGRESTYFFLQNGDVYSKPNLMDSLQYVGSIQAPAYKRLLEFVNLMELEQYDYQNPGNSYSFFSASKKDSSAPKRVVWTMDDEGVKPAMTDVHKLMMQYVAKLEKDEEE